MRPLVVVEADPVADHSAGVLQRLEAMPMYALLFERTDHSLHQAVLLRRVGRDELLSKSVAAYQCGEAATGEDATSPRFE